MDESDDRILYQDNGVTVSRGRLVLPESLDEQSGRPRTIAVNSLREAEIKPGQRRVYGVRDPFHRDWISCTAFCMFRIFRRVEAVLGLAFALVCVSIGVVLICLRGETSKWYIRLKFAGEGSDLDVCNSRTYGKVRGVMNAINMALDAR